MPAINGRLEACGVRDLRAEALLETGAVGRPLGAASHERQVRSQGPSRDGRLECRDPLMDRNAV